MLVSSYELSIHLTTFPSNHFDLYVEIISPSVVATFHNLSCSFRKSISLLSQSWHPKWFRGDGIKEEVICLLRWLMVTASSADWRLHLSFASFRRNCIQLSCWTYTTTRSTRNTIFTINHVLPWFYLLRPSEILCTNCVTWTNLIVDLSLLKLLKYFDEIFLGTSLCHISLFHRAF